MLKLVCQKGDKGGMAGGKNPQLLLGLEGIVHTW